MGQLAVGSGFVFDEASGAVLPDGGLLYSRDQYGSCDAPVIDHSGDVFAQEAWPADDGGWISTPYGLATDYSGLVEIDVDGGTRGRQPLWSGYTFALGNAGTIFALPASPIPSCSAFLPTDTAKQTLLPGPIVALSGGTLARQQREPKLPRVAVRVELSARRRARTNRPTIHKAPSCEPAVEQPHGCDQVQSGKAGVYRHPWGASKVPSRTTTPPSGKI